ncbi:hypothetical protein [uncultured Lacinutrix sp.]|uniref:hypothetical protein n=1 Tax=uncultured Lacinutrix sp. TaxID=574032 RepID=UPI00260A4CEE|nr:hypothetical protein [uncultured Lacinutrix sp.]
MTKKLFISLALIVLISCSQQPTLIEQYKAEISALKTEEEIDAYWKKLHEMDQKALEKEKQDVRYHDSVSITHMLRTALMFEIHGSKTYKYNNIVAELHFTHNYFGVSNIAFWPIIKECVKVKGEKRVILYPAYQLEGMALTFYDYTVSSQELKHNELLNTLNKIESDSVSKTLFEALKYQTKINNLKEVNVIGKWQRELFKDVIEDGFFEFVKMSDNSLYYRKNKRLQKLEFIKSQADSKFYRIEKEPFDWSYELKSNGDLSLLDNKNEILIEYSKF